MRTATLRLVYWNNTAELLSDVTGYRETIGDRLEIFLAHGGPLYVSLEYIKSYGYV